MMKKTRIANKVAEDSMNRLDELAVLCYYDRDEDVDQYRSYDTEFRPEFDKQMYGKLIVKECAWVCAWLVRQETSYTGEVLLEEKIKKHFGINDLYDLKCYDSA